jgi:hypothetical protein
MPRRRILRDLGSSAAGGLGIAAALNVEEASATRP